MHICKLWLQKQNQGPSTNMFVENWGYSRRRLRQVSPSKRSRSRAPLSRLGDNYVAKFQETFSTSAQCRCSVSKSLRCPGLIPLVWWGAIYLAHIQQPQPAPVAADTVSMIIVTALRPRMACKTAQNYISRGGIRLCRVVTRSRKCGRHLCTCVTRPCTGHAVLVLI